MIIRDSTMTLGAFPMNFIQGQGNLVSLTLEVSVY